ncbi:MAG: zf-HC2 domain-containing protein [Candidatus Aenigmarchaeota archaeon]|nr:zf-HC2 domain-containing protein [Candidatus Aenigmarchaeota archaeon]
MKCKEVNKKLVSYINDELSNTENKNVKSHLESCAICNEIAVELQNTMNLFDDRITLQPNPFLYTRILQELNNLHTVQDNNGFLPVFKKVLLPVMFSLLLIFSVFLGITLGNIYETNQQEKETSSLTIEYFFNDLEQETVEVSLLNE